MISRNKTAPDLQGLTLVVVVCAWLVGIFCNFWLLLPPLILLPGAFAALVLAILLWRESLSRLVMLSILFLLIGAWRYAIATPTGDPQAISAFIGTGKLEVQGTVADEPKPGARSRLLLIDVNRISKNGGTSWQDAHGQMEVQVLGSFLSDPYGPNYGDTVQLQGKLQPPGQHSPPSVFASMSFPRVSVQSAGGNPIIAALYSFRIKLATILLQALPQPEAALLVAILLGLRTPALGPLLLAFNVTGTAHLIVPSGFKVTILAGIVIAGTRWLYEKKERQFRPLLPAQKRRNSRSRWLANILVIMSIAAYTILSGSGPAALRAGAMGILLAIAPRFGRIYNIYTSLALTAFLMSLLNPFVLWEAGFQLSYLGTLGIVMLTPHFQRLLSPIERVPFGHYLAEIAAVTLAAQTATLPIFALTFNQISFIAPIANMLTVPLLGALIFLGIVVCGTGLIFAQLALLSGWVVWPLLWYVAKIVTFCSNLPGAYLSVSNLSSGVAWCYYGLLLTVAIIVLRKWPVQNQFQQVHTLTLFSKRTWRIIQIGAALLVILATGAQAIAAQPDGQLKISFFNVAPSGKPAQGEAIFIQTPDGKLVLIDGGPDASSLAQELDSRVPFWQRSLDMVLLTTPKQDHLAGLQDVVTRYQVGEVLDAGMLHPNTGYALWRRTITERNFQYVQLHQRTTVSMGTQVQLQVLWPPAQLHKGSNEERDNALVIRLIAPAQHLRVLLLGEAALSTFALAGLLGKVEPDYLKADIVQIVGVVGKTFPPELRSILQKAGPSLLVITPATLSSKLSKAGATTVLPSPPGLFGAQVVQTAQTGTVEIGADANGWNIQTP